VSAILARVARLLDLDRPAPGERTRWTVRTAHGVYLVELEQFVSGTRVRLDGKTIAHRPPWSFADVPFRFPIGAAAATLAVSPDTRAGTIRPTLIVDDARVPVDVPAWRRRKPVPVPWRSLLARGGYALAVLLIVAAIAGDPFERWIVTTLRAAVDVAWFAAIRGIDPFGLVPPWVDGVTSSRAALLLLGIELGALVTLARDARTRCRLPLVGSTSWPLRSIGWIALVAALALFPLVAAAG